MHINQLKTSKFLTKEDVGTGVLVTVRDCLEQNVAKEGEPAEMKWCLHLAETEKPLILNSTNGQIIAGFLGSDETDDWRGRQIVLYNEPSVSFGSKVTGGIRARAPRVKSAVLPQAPPPVAHAPAVHGQPVTNAWPTTPSLTPPTPVAPRVMAIAGAPILPPAETDDIPF